MTDPPIYQQLAAQHAVDVPDGMPAPDAQSIAYRNMGSADIVLDGELPGMAERIHPAYVPGSSPPPAAVEEYEAADWDAERIDPRDGTGKLCFAPLRAWPKEGGLVARCARPHGHEPPCAPGHH